MRTHTIIIILCLFIYPSAAALAQELNEHCIVNILNRTIQVDKEGGWALPNVPSNMGKVRARATCTQPDGSTISGQSDYFTLTNNTITKVGEIKFDGQAQIPSELIFTPSTPVTLNGAEKTASANVTARFADSSEQDVTASTSGITYTSTNPTTATVSAEGLITAKNNGSVLINASKDGVLASLRVTVITSGDLDKDGLPDEWETANGLNPADPIDANEDIDEDKLSALDEFKEGTNPNKPDSDADGLYDAIEIFQTKTSPILSDTDDDGLNDSLELKLLNSDPLKASSANYASAITTISVTPPTLTLTFNGVDTEVSTQLTVTGKLIDGSSIDLTPKSRGTTYASSNQEVANFGIEDGRVFGGKAGNAVITVKNGEHSYPLAMVVETFTPSALSAIEIPGYPNNVKISSDTAYVAAGAAGLQILDISNRKAPRIVGSLDTDGTAIDLRIRGNQIYLADGEGGLKIIDATTPTAPKLLGTLKTAGITQDIQIYGNYAYLANGAAGIEIVDISNPATPVSISTLENLGTVKGIDVDSNNIFVVNETALISIDALFKESPARIAALNLGPTKDLVINKGYAHVAISELGYRIVDIKDPADPFVVSGDRAIKPRDLAINNDLAFYAEELFLNDIGYINIEAPSNPLFQGTISLQNFAIGYGGTGIDLDATYAYVTKVPRPVKVDYSANEGGKLFIAQYRASVDNAGQAPQTTLLSPSQGDVRAEYATLNVRAHAQDDVAVKQVEFFADDLLIGSDNTAPYEVPYTVPVGKRFVVLKSKATDLAGNKSDSELVRINIQPDKDRDNLGNDDEVELYNTNPNIADTDQDRLTDGEEIAIKTNPLKSDSDSDGIEDGDEVKQKTDPLNPDTTPPQVQSTIPVANAQDIPENQGITIKFTESISAKSVKTGAIKLNENNSATIEGSLKLLSENELLFTPNSILKDSTKYNVIVAGIHDKAGNKLENDFKFEYTTGDTVDTKGPAISKIWPNNLSTNIAKNTMVTFAMNEPIDLASINETKIYLSDTVTGKKTFGTISLNEDKMIINFFPESDLLVGRKYKFYVAGIKDLFGNEMTSKDYYFTTAFDTDREAPKILATSIDDGTIDVPLNVRFRVLFNERVSERSLKSIKLYSNGNEIPVERKIEANSVRGNLYIPVNPDTVFSIAPKAPLSPQTQYQWHIGAVEDSSGNLLEHEKIISFTTSTQNDIQIGSILKSPSFNFTSVPLNKNIELLFSENIDPTYITDNTIYLRDSSYGIGDSDIKGRIEINKKTQSLIFIPAQPLIPNHKYYYHLENDDIRDRAGNKFNIPYSISYFTTGNNVDNNAPSLTKTNFAAGSTNIPINTMVNLRFNEPLNQSCVNTDTVRLTRKADGIIIAGTTSLAEDGRSLTFAPINSLSTSTAYELIVDGACDLGNNKMPRTTHGFTTDNISLADKTPPSITNIIPVSNSTSISLDSAITITFNEPIDATNLDKLQVTASGITGQLAGTWSLTSNTLRFKPLNSLPPSSTIYVYCYGVRDLAGNTINISSPHTFTTASGEDKTAPQIESISPANGAMDIGPYNPIVLTFSKSIRNDTITSNNIMLYIEGVIVKPTIYSSPDNRIISLETGLPAAKSVTVVVTSDVKDLAGNALAEFASTFSTAVVNTDTTRPNILSQTPVSGANKVRNINSFTLYANEQLDAATINQGIYVAADGVLVEGTASLDSTQQIINFETTDTLPENSLIEVYVTDKIRDISGNPLFNYQGSFRTGSNTGATPGVIPTVETFYRGPSSLNPLFEIAFSETLNPSSINSDSVQLRKSDSNGAIEPVQLSVSEDGRRVRVKPIKLLETNTSYKISILSGISDIDGDKRNNTESYSFSTDRSAAADTLPPQIVLTSPKDEGQNIPINPTFQIRFDEEINPLSVNTQGNDQVSFLEGNKEIRYVKDHPLKMDSDNTETFSGILDGSGNEVATTSIHFRTSKQVDTTAPTSLLITPRSGLRDAININSIIQVKFSEPLNPFTVTPTTLELFSDYGDRSAKKTDAVVSLSADGQTASLTPTAPLNVRTYYSVVLGQIQDLALNRVNRVEHHFFTSSDIDTQPPVIENATIDNNQIAVPLNARLRVFFNEHINTLKLSDVVLTLDGIAVSANVDSRFDVNAEGSWLTLTPKQFLNPNTTYELVVGGIEDLSGNRLAEPLKRSFTTSAKLDFQQGSVTSFSPADNSSNVPPNTEIKLTFSEIIDPTTINAYDSFSLAEIDPAGNSRQLVGRIAIGADKKSLIFKPAELLKANYPHRYRFGYLDLAGNGISGQAFFTTASQ